MSRYDSAITEMLWELSLVQGEDDQIGTTGELGWFARFDGPLSADEIDRHNEIVMSLEKQQEEGYREHLMKAANIKDAMTASGFILEQHDSGAVNSTVYWTRDELLSDWSDIEDQYHVERCDECQAEAEMYGQGMPIEHDEGCSFVETAAYKEVVRRASPETLKLWGIEPLTDEEAA